MRHTLQNSLYPSFTLSPDPRLFFKGNDNALVNIKERNINLLPGGKINTFTYFNGLTIHKWKPQLTGEELFFKITVQGQLLIRFQVSSLESGTQSVFEKTLTSNDLQEFSFDLPFWRYCSQGILSFELFALKASRIEVFSYYTEFKSSEPFKLGIVITHFNRQMQVINAIERLKKGLLEDPETRDRVGLIVVDNSQNLPPLEGAKVIKSTNLGGAGGFTRGLLYLKAHPEFTHCLFMDDDASSEVESVKRAMVFLEGKRKEKLAIAGAMLTEKEVYRQYECGAYFDGKCHSLGKGLNLLYEHDLLKNEIKRRVEYGAWWFFAFAIEDVEHNAFPYFVRGDDISFSYANRFNITTLNGIACWQPDFSNKSTPQSVYLDMRNHLMHVLHGFVRGNKYLNMLKSSLLIYIYYTISYFYDSAAAVNMAIDDVLKGPEFWRDNADMVEKRKQIKAMVKNEIPVPVPENTFSQGVMADIEKQTTVDIVDRGLQITPATLMRYFTFNGHLLPLCVFHKGFTWLKKSSGSRMSSSFRYKKVVMLIDGNNQALILHINKKRFFKESFRFIYLLGRLFWNTKKLSRQYQKSYSDLTSDAFWMRQYAKDD